MKKENVFLVIIFFLISSSILVKSFFHIDGYLSSDSHDYLKLAQNLLNGNGFFLKSTQNSEEVFFSMWPIGYSYSIFLVAKLSNLSVFWASKILNIIFIGLILFNLRLKFGKNAYLLASIFLFASFIDLFTYTWSETMFVFIILSFAISLQNFIKKSDNLFQSFVFILLSTLLLFLTRYAGIYSFAVLLFFIFYFVYLKNYKKTILIASILLINLIIIIIYFNIIYNETNHILGGERIFFPREFPEFILLLMKALIGEIIIIDTHIRTTYFYIIIYSIYLLFNIVLLFHIYNKRKLFLDTKNNISNSKFYGLLGVIYYMFIILASYVIGFDSLNYRLLSPGSLFIFISIICYIIDVFKEKYFNYFKIILILIALFSWTVHFPIKTLTNI